MTTSPSPAASVDAIKSIVDAWDSFDGQRLPVDRINEAFDYLALMHSQAVALMMIVAEVRKRTLKSEHEATIKIVEQAFGRKSNGQ